MKEFLDQAAICSCPHSQMTVRLIQALAEYRMENTLTREDFPAIAKEILDYVSVRVSNPDLVPSYQMFIMSKIEMAFKVVLQVKDLKVEEISEDLEQVSEDMLDIPIEDFQGVVFDEEYCKRLGI